MTKSYEVGSLIAVTSGEYSDYCLMGHMRVLRPFSQNEVVAEFKARGPWKVKGYPPVPTTADDEDGEDWDCHDRFLAWLVSEGYAEPVESVQTMYIGAYSHLEGEEE